MTDAATKLVGKDFVISRVLDAPRDLVWKCFTDPERMKQWWGPKGVKVRKSKMDLRAGGSYHYAMETPDGKVMWGKFVYREITPPERLVFINSFSDEAGGLTRHPMNRNRPGKKCRSFNLKKKGRQGLERTRPSSPCAGRRTIRPQKSARPSMPGTPA